MAKSPDICTIEDPGFFHIMGCSLMANEDFKKEILITMKKFVEKGAKISFDPNIREELLHGRNIGEITDPVMKHCSVLLPGEEELLLLTGENSEEAAVKNVLNNGVAEIVAVKKGKRGCKVYTRDGSFSLGVYTVTPVDSTGAGDCFDAAFLCGLLENKPLVECAKTATAAASLNTSAFGPMEGDISIDTVRTLMAGEEINK